MGVRLAPEHVAVSNDGVQFDGHAVQFGGEFGGDGRELGAEPVVLTGQSRHVLEQRVLPRGKFTRVGRSVYVRVVVSVRGAVTDVWSVKPVVYGAGVE